VWFKAGIPAYMPIWMDLWAAGLAHYNHICCQLCIGWLTSRMGRVPYNTNVY